MKRWIVALLLSLSVSVARAELFVENLIVQQVPGTKTVEISCDVSGAGFVDVSLAVSNGAQAVSAASLSGDVGTNVTAGAGMTVVWDGGADWDGQAAALFYTLTVSDGMDVAAVSCPVAKTGQTTEYYAGDDGTLQAGADWPNPRFTDLGNTILDNLTGLEWIENPHSLSGNSFSVNWNSAIDFCEGLSFAGHDDWRLPNHCELRSVVDYGSSLPVSEVFGLGSSSSYYWSSTTKASSSNNVWMLRVGDPSTTYTTYKSNSSYVWPVRFRQAGAPASVPQTGQTNEYYAGDDGTYKAGAVWPDPRFVDRGNTVLDNLTGLEWVKAPHDLTNNAGRQVWNDAIDFCEALDFDGHTDWRIPNVRELESLVHCGVESLSNWLNGIFSGISGSSIYYYWSGTTYASVTGYAWGVSMNSGAAKYGNNKLYGQYVWPVRTCQVSAGAASTVVTDTRDYTLTVTSEHGSPVPSTGVHTYAWGTDLTLSSGTDSVYTCTGWIGTGDVSASGTNSEADSIVLTNNLISSITWNWEQILEGFALWADEQGLEGEPAELFVQDRDGDGVANGFEYAFGDNLSSNMSLLRITLVDGMPVVEIPERDSSTLSYVNTQLEGSADLTEWTLPLMSTNGAPFGREWFCSQTPVSNAFFRLDAELQ